MLDILRHANILIQNIVQILLRIFTLHILYDWITIMGYSKHELSTVNMLYSLRKFVMLPPPPPPPPFLPITATLPMHNGHFLLSPEVRLYSILFDYPAGASAEEGVALCKVNYPLWRSVIQKIPLTRTFCITRLCTGAANE